MAAVQSVVRSWSLLTTVAAHAEAPLGLVGLAEAVDLPTSTAARLLATLESLNAVERDDDGAYRIGSQVAAIGATHATESTLRSVAHPHMVELVALTDEAVGLCVPVDGQTVTIAQVDTPRSVQAEDWSGTRWPIHLGGSGDVLMAHWDTEQVEGHLADIQRTDPATAQRVRDRITAAGRAGVAWSHGDYVTDLSSVAAPILDHNDVAIAALYVYGPSYRFPDPQTKRRVEDLLCDRARRISTAWSARRASPHPQEVRSDPVTA